MNKLIRVTTVPISLEKLLENQLKYMNDFYEVIVVSSDKKNLKEVGKKQGVRTHAVEMTRTISPIKDVVSLVKMTKFLIEEKPFIVHTHTPKAGVIGMLAAKIAGVPHRLHTVAGLPLLETTGSKRKLLNFVEKFTYSCATAVYPNSKGLEQIIIDKGFCGSKKLKVLANGSSNGINTSYFAPELFTHGIKKSLKKELGISEYDFVFVFVGRLVKDKGINELVKAFSKLSEEYINSKLILVGSYESDLDPLLPETVEVIKKSNSIIETGYQADVRPYFGISDVLLFPSYREGFPNVVMQAGAMGLPAIVTNINGCNEIIIEGENGIIIPVKDSDALYNAMCDVIIQEDFFVRMKMKAREMIVSRYEQMVVWKAIHEEYKMLENGI